ncbi:MAG: gluconate 2-dehydrogenase subunit 3 family protein [Caldimonas sp.]
MKTSVMGDEGDADTGPLAPRLQRRQVLALVVALSGVGSGLVACHSSTAPAERGSSGRRGKVTLAFFTAAEAAFVDAAIARLIPADDLGAGAVEAGVTVFIDRQLAGPFGRAVDWYMQGPWADGTPQQGYQRKRTPAELYRAAIAALDSRSQHGAGKAFAALDSDRQDALLHELEGGGIDLGDVSAKDFFTLLWDNTQEGYFADPIYLGNQGFAGWKLVGYPGPRYNYDAAIRRFGERYPLPTVGLMGRDPARLPTGPI